MRKFIYLFVALALLVPALPNQARADSKKFDHKIRICHATASASNPYNSIEVDKNATAGGHLGHEGDISPEYWALTFQGLKKISKNWDEEGQAIWHNDCQVPEPVDCQYHYAEPTVLCGTEELDVIVDAEPANGGLACPTEPKLYDAGECTYHYWCELVKEEEPPISAPLSEPIHFTAKTQPVFLGWRKVEVRDVDENPEGKPFEEGMDENCEFPPEPVDCVYHYEEPTVVCGTEELAVVVDSPPVNGGLACPTEPKLYDSEIACEEEEKPEPVDCAWVWSKPILTCGEEVLHVVATSPAEDGGKECPINTKVVDHGACEVEEVEAPAVTPEAEVQIKYESTLAPTGMNLDFLFFWL